MDGRVKPGHDASGHSGARCSREPGIQTLLREIPGSSAQGAAAPE
jgi:hypothetical protein